MILERGDLGGLLGQLAVKLTLQLLVQLQLLQGVAWGVLNRAHGGLYIESRMVGIIIENKMPVY